MHSALGCVAVVLGLSRWCSACRARAQVSLSSALSVPHNATASSDRCTCLEELGLVAAGGTRRRLDRTALVGRGGELATIAADFARGTRRRTDGARNETPTQVPDTGVPGQQLNWQRSSTRAVEDSSC
jgi:hypothetical protein